MWCAAAVDHRRGVEGDKSWPTQVGSDEVKTRPGATRGWADHLYLLLIPATLRPSGRAGKIEYRERSGVDCNGKCVEERGLQEVNKFSTSAAQRMISV